MTAVNRALVALVVVLGACKTDDAKPTPRANVPAQPQPRSPAPDAGARAARPDAPLDLARVEELAPRLEGATVMSPARMHQADQARQVWCVAGSDAAAIAHEIARELTASGWSEVSTRGTSERAGAAGTQDGVRISITVGGRDASCPGLVASAVYAGASVTLPTLAPGERIR